MPDHPLVAICPVSLHDPQAKQATTNVSAIWPPLGPVSAPIRRRLEAIKASTRAEKARLKGLGKDAAYAYAVMAFALSETLTIARPEALGLLPANMLISNVRGPERPLYLNGARLETFFPVSTLIVGRRPEHHLHVLRGPDGVRLHRERLVAARGREHGALHGRGVRRARARRGYLRNSSVPTRSPSGQLSASCPAT